ncbi:hypothetical protein YC2023_078501 [Brassica napus]
MKEKTGSWIFARNQEDDASELFSVPSGRIYQNPIMASKAYKLTHKHYGSMFKKEDWSLEQEAAYIRDAKNFSVT